MSTESTTTFAEAARGDGTDGQHFITWDDDGHANFTCASPQWAPCRRWCTECEEECPLTSEDGRQHVWQDVDYCRIVSWLAAGPARDTWMDSGEPMPQRDGLIYTEWDGDSYMWDQADVG